MQAIIFLMIIAGIMLLACFMDSVYRFVRDTKNKRDQRKQVMLRHYLRQEEKEVA